MQPTQDKDLDRYFNDTFKDAEIAPSKDLWGTIEPRIELKRKRTLPVYWFAAAAVLLVVAVGVLTFNTVTKRNTDQQSAKSVKHPNAGVKNDLVKVAVVEKAGFTHPLNENKVQVKVKSAKDKYAVEIPIEHDKFIASPETKGHEILISKLEDHQQEIKKKMDDVILQPNQEIVLASNETALKSDEVTAETTRLESKGILNVGDVVNLIVNKVDKRKDKFIQFKTDDDDNSSLASINIGPFKFGKRTDK